jgi:hypothetical protein
MANSTSGADSPNSYTDPLANVESCQRDVPILQELRTNTIRVYALDPTANHTVCMQLLAEAGIYVIADLSQPALSIDRDSPSWNDNLYSRYTAVVDDMSQYNNTLGFFAGNEVSNQPNNTDASAFVKAAVRDTKAYIKAQNYRQIGEIQRILLTSGASISTPGAAIHHIRNLVTMFKQRTLRTTMFLSSLPNMAVIWLPLVLLHKFKLYTART